mmetsp:Transcript_117398/g.226367  ORF Transcript_117398/g.226367 Transcript_117398/m.226367 type:complete len:430 (+) Transcript_117398:184-1473(+)
MTTASAQGVKISEMMYAQRVLDDLQKRKELSTQVNNIQGALAGLHDTIRKLQERAVSIEKSSAKADTSADAVSSWVEDTVKSIERRLWASLEQRVDEKMDIVVKKITKEFLSARVDPAQATARSAEDKAATTIQASQRGKQQRMAQKKTKAAITQIQAAWRGLVCRKKLGRWDFSSAVVCARRKHQGWARIWDEERGDSPGLDQTSFPIAFARIHPHLTRAQQLVIFSGYVRSTGSDIMGVSDFCNVAEVCGHSQAAAAEVADTDLQTFLLLGMDDAENAAQRIQAVQRGRLARAEHQARVSAACKIQRAVKVKQARLRNAGDNIDIATAARYVRQRYSGWAAIFDEARGSENELNESTFETAVRRVFETMTAGQAQALYDGYLAGTRKPPVTLSAFCTIAEAAASGEDKAADFADMTLERYRALKNRR